MGLSRYLYYIQNINNPKDKLRNCKYFCYKLKKELGKFSSDHKDIEISYKTINKPIQNVFDEAKTFIYVCPGFDDYPDDHSLKILKDLENAYNIIEELNIKHNDCTSSNEKYEQYMNSLKSCQYSNKISFKLILKSIKDLYEEKCPKEKIPWDSSSMVTQTSEVTNNRTMESTKNTPETKSIVLSNEETTNFPMKESAKDTMTEKITRVYIGTFSLISVILTAIFILYKVKNKICDENTISSLYYQYTPYGSYLLTWINNFKRRLNKKNKEHLNLMDSFEKRHENSIDERYRIAYNSVDYS